jgi:MFS family permease
MSGVRSVRAERNSEGEACPELVEGSKRERHPPQTIQENYINSSACTSHFPMYSCSLTHNPLLLCVYHGLAMALFPIAIITLLWKDQFGLSMAEIMLLQAVFGIIVAAMELPSGYIADRIGYRPTLLGAAVFSVLGWAVYLVAYDFWTVALAEGMLGLAFSFISGADTALLYESLRETEREHEFAWWYGRFRFSGEIAEGSAALAAGLLFAWWDRLPFLLEIAAWGMCVVIAWLLVEPSRHRPPITQTWTQVQGLFRFAFKLSGMDWLAERICPWYRAAYGVP